jgi:hypothetical protein
MLRKHLGSLIKLIGQMAVSTSARAQTSRLLVLIVEIRLSKTVSRLNFWSALIIQFIELTSELLKILRLYDKIRSIWSIALILENWSQGLRLWDHLSSGLLVDCARFTVLELIIVVNEWRANTNIAFSWHKLFIIIIVRVTLVISFLIIDFLNQAQLNMVSSLRAFWGILISEISAGYSLALGHNILSLSITAISRAW